MILEYELDDKGNLIIGTRVLKSSVVPMCSECKNDLDVVQGSYFCNDLKRAWCGGCFSKETFRHTFRSDKLGFHTDFKVDKIEVKKK